MSNIYLIGLNHRTATVEIREKFALTEFTSPETWPFARKVNLAREAVKKENTCCVCKANEIDSSEQLDAIKLIEKAENIPTKLAVEEALILSTCNRVEILVIHNGPSDDILSAWSEARCCTIEDIRPYVYVHEGVDAIRHLFTVASSLDSLVLGEPQILGQLKSAYRLSVQAGHAGLLVNKILHKAFSVAKRVRSETSIASSAVSISYAAVELAKRIFDDMPKHEALLLGAGEMAELAAVHLKNNGIRRLRIVNRTFARAEELAGRMDGEAFPFESLRECLIDTDIVISSTGAQESIITVPMMQEVMKARKNRPMFLIDIAMPRDIDPAVNGLDNVYVYDIDDLKEVVEENLANRKEEAHKAHGIVEEESENFRIWYGSLDMKPTIVDIVERGEELARNEVAKAMKRLKKLGIDNEELETVLLGMAQAIVNKQNHAPLHYLRVSYKHNQNIQNIVTVKKVLGLD